MMCLSIFYSYYKLSKNADKEQETFEKMINSNKPEDQILKGQGFQI